MKNENLKLYVKYVWPSILSMIGSSCYVLVDTVFVTRIDENALAALNIVLPIYSVMTTFGSFVTIGAATYYSILMARHEEKESSIFFSHALVFGVATSVLMTILVMLNKYSIAAFLGANEETMLMCIDYLNAYVTLSPFIVLQHLLASFIRNDGEPRLASMSGLAGSLFNLCFDYFFIFTLGMGMFGAALATGLAPVVGLLVMSPYLIKKRNHFHLVKFRPSIDVLKKIGKIGLPTFIQGVSSGFVMLVFNRQLLAIGGNMAVTAYGIIVNISVVIQYIMMGITEGTQPLISSNYGSRAFQNIRDFAGLAIRTILGVATLGMLLAVFGGDLVIWCFDPQHNETLRVMTRSAMIIYFVGLYPHGLTSFFSVYFTSVETPLPSTILSILKTGIVITPLALILPVFMGLTGVWVSYPASEALIMMVGLVMYVRSPYLKKK